MKLLIGLGFLALLLALLIVYLEKNNPEKTASWLSFLAINPLLGLLIYMVFGCTPIKRKLFQQKHIPGERLPRLSHQQKQAFLKEEIYIQESIGSKSLSRLLLSKAFAPLSRNNSVSLLHNGQEKFKALLQDLERARDHIHMEYYIFHDDVIGRTIQQILIRKACEGIKVRLVFDGLGSRSLSKDFSKKLKSAGVEIQWFLPLSFPKALFTLNYRNHRKLVVIDGRIGYLGGINIGDEYLSRSSNYGFWRDTHLRIEGTSVHTIQETFFNDWYYLTKEIHREYRYFPKCKTDGEKLVQIIGGGPDSKYEAIKELFFTMLCTAQKEIVVTTPYFIPDESMIMALKTAASRGVSVKIIVQGKPDHRLTFLASSSYFNDLIPSGVEVYQYQKGILHSKVLTIDKEISVVGSANFDIRSFQIDFELSAVIFSSDFAEELVRDQEQDLTDSIQMTQEDLQSRTPLFSFQIALARLLSPLL
ncbi:cardiolipin synthase [Desulfitobacterium sp. PCE1]|uniref:cardiolipin synthase n=1 Tax=Desulfitobacterium sp. PCE1 TaxID=146907 RepID=UPI00035CD459|nr:cardiolipin synthase [Desulfitobacterium sp. PCE1]